ncbi:MAG: hypothetical protein HY673_10270 [Chloroflexi bacterium]|nr:hypothetical protein [Chloroflexota bacterium]
MGQWLERVRARKAGLAELENTPKPSPEVDSSLKEQVEFLIAEVTRCLHCNQIAWRLNGAGGWTCGVCHPEKGEEV